MGASLHTTSRTKALAGLEPSVEPADDCVHLAFGDLPEPYPLTVAELEVIETFLAKTLDELFNN